PKEANIAWGRLILLGEWGSGMNSFTAVSEVPRGGPRIVARFGRADRDRAFRAAVRHSRHVRILRVAVPLAAGVVLLSGVAGTLLLKPLRAVSGAAAGICPRAACRAQTHTAQPRPHRRAP